MSLANLPPGTSIADVFKLVVQVVKDTDVVLNVTAASLAALVYDSLLCLGKEVPLIWHSKRSFGKYLYLINRYSVIVAVSATMYFWFQEGPSSEFCAGYFRFYPWAFYFTSLPSQLIFLFRTYAMYRTKFMKYLLSTLFVLYNMSLLAEIILVEVLGHPGPVPFTTATCTLTLNTIPKFTATIQAVIQPTLNMVLFSLTGWKAIQLRRQGRTNLIDALFVTCMTYYIWVILTQITVLALNLALPTTRLLISTTFDTFLVCGAAIFATRTMLSLREASSFSTQLTLEVMTNEMAFKAGSKPTENSDSELDEVENTDQTIEFSTFAATSPPRTTFKSSNSTLIDQSAHLGTRHGSAQ